MKEYSKLTIRDRYLIKDGIDKREKISEIARKLARCKIRLIIVFEIDEVRRYICEQGR